MICDRCKGKFSQSDMQISYIVQRPKCITEWLCYPCYHEKRRILDLVNMHRARARKLGLLDTLTVDQWLAALAHFNYLCAYCLTDRAVCLEHFIPLTLGGGTTKDNVVPACIACNKRKRNKHPDHVSLIPRHDIDRVRSYLQHQMDF